MGKSFIKRFFFYLVSGKMNAVLLYSFSFVYDTGGKDIEADCR